MRFNKLFKLTLLHLFLASVVFISYANTIHGFEQQELGKEIVTIPNEFEVGKEFLLHLHRYYKIMDDLYIVSYINELGRKLSSTIGYQRNFRFLTIDSTVVNAFAGPNGIIGIHSGLINKTSTESELAGVIAHEIAHVTQQHLYRQAKIAQEGKSNITALFLAMILLGVSGSADLSVAGIYAGLGYKVEQALSYSRMYELEADNKGFEYLSKTDIPTDGMIDFFLKLDEGNQSLEILRTHPLDSDRLAKLKSKKNYVKQENNSDLFSDPLSYYLIKQRLQILKMITELREDSILIYFRNLVNMNYSKDYAVDIFICNAYLTIKSIAPQIHISLNKLSIKSSFYNKKGKKAKKGKKILNMSLCAAIAKKVNNKYLSLVYADYLLQQGKLESEQKALSIMQHLYKIYLQNYLFNIKYAQALIRVRPKVFRKIIPENYHNMLLGNYYYAKYILQSQQDKYKDKKYIYKAILDLHFWMIQLLEKENNTANNNEKTKIRKYNNLIHKLTLESKLFRVMYFYETGNLQGAINLFQSFDHEDYRGNKQYAIVALKLLQLDQK